MASPRRTTVGDPHTVARMAITSDRISELSPCCFLLSAYFESTVTAALSRNDLAPFSLGYPQIYTPYLWVTG